MVSSLIPYHVQQTSHLCLYQLGKKPFPPTLFFPKVKTVALINCTSVGVSNILRPSIFPNLNQVHYLSSHPGCFNLHTQFQKPISWVFPNLRYPFYQCMFEAGHGRVENQLIRTYIQQFVKFPRGAEMMLYLPGYDVMAGSEYARHLRQYLYQPKYHRNQSYSNEISQYYAYQYDPHPNLFDHPNPYFECGSSEHSLSAFFQQKLEEEFMDYILSEYENELKNKCINSD